MTTADGMRKRDCAIRFAGAEDLTWVNACYAGIRFMPSTPDHRVAIGEVDRERAGVGRLVPLGEAVYELGGIYVLPPFRGTGVAQALIEFLLKAAGRKDVYCIPYAHLRPLYESAGFVEVRALHGVPEQVRKKLEWCRGTYAEPVLLMERRFQGT